jgi:hypothetical protein
MTLVGDPTLAQLRPFVGKTVSLIECGGDSGLRIHFTDFSYLDFSLQIDDDEKEVIIHIQTRIGGDA